jgi:hypothetical protein
VRRDHPYLADEHLARFAEWVRRLRSGTRAQGREALITLSDDGTREKYCCLGVATEMAEEAGVITAVRSVIDSGRRRVLYPDGPPPRTTLTVLPNAVQLWLGLSDQVDPWVTLSDGSVVALTIANDGLGLNFDQIAELIEKEYLLDGPQ